MDFLSLGKEPIRVEQPAGADVRYDPFFEELQAEVDKLSTPSAAGAIDWEKIVNLSSEILAQKSKDLLVASYLSVALIYTRKFGGLAIGLQFYRDLLEHFWDGLFPPKARMRGRVGAIEWWAEKSETALSLLPPAPIAQDQLVSLNENLEKIEEFFRQNIEEPPALSPLHEYVNSLAALSEEPEQAKAPAKEPGEASQEATSSKPQEDKRAEIPAEISSPQEAQEAINQGFQRIREATTYLRKEDLSNPAVYRLTRMAVWAKVEALPPANNGRTPIPPPAPFIKDPLNDLRSKGNDEAFVRAAEASIGQNIFWMDLHCWVAEALARLGNQYERAREAVGQETAFFVQRLAGIEELLFADGTPFADPETREWLKGMAPGTSFIAAGSSSPQGSASAEQDEDLMRSEVEEAKGLIKKGKLLEAVERLQQRLRTNFSKREKLLWRLSLSQLLVGANQVKLALPHLEQILQDIDDYRLEEYDPLVALRSLKVVWLGLDSQADAESKKKASGVMDRMAKLDLAEVIRLEKGKKR
ncbi:MAG: type VI secretion system protein TssA [Thermodesulfobacteriota bacterium]|nr:type VI secretion system protein TssA [Thermodesulfobacteriota bacterium]